MRIAVPAEERAGERRVALVPEVAGRLSATHEVLVEPGAGAGALLPDHTFTDAGATVVDAASGLADADVWLCVAPPSPEVIASRPKGSVVMGFLQPLTSKDTMVALRDAGVTGIALEAVPRISRAQSMDALSSQASVAGYRAVLLGSSLMTRYLPMLTTAAGTVPPAKVLVLGAGVAGLQAIATARRLGARVTAYDVRPETAEQIESLGAKALDLGIDASGEGGYARELTDEERAQQQERLDEAIAGFDLVVTTAQVPGGRAPKLVTARAIEAMSPGSVVVDMAGDGGGNTELTEPGETIVVHDVTITSPLNLPAAMPEHASMLLAKNFQNLLAVITGEEGELTLDLSDDVLTGAVVVHDGEIRHERAKALVDGDAGEAPAAEGAVAEPSGDAASPADAAAAPTGREVEAEPVDDPVRVDADGDGDGDGEPVAAREADATAEGATASSTTASTSTDSEEESA